MAPEKRRAGDEAEPLTRPSADDSRNSIDSSSTVSDSFKLLNVLQSPTDKNKSEGENGRYADNDIEGDHYGEPEGVESARPRKMPRRTKLALWAIAVLALGVWFLAFFVFLARGPVHTQAHSEPAPAAVSATSADVDANSNSSAGKKKLALKEVLDGTFSPNSHSISWIAGPNGEDGLLLEQDSSVHNQYLRVENATARKGGKALSDSGSQPLVLMKHSFFTYGDTLVHPSNLWPSPDLKKVLVVSDVTKGWRYSRSGKYWLFDVESQTAKPLDPELPDTKIQLATWSPKSDSVVFTRDNNMFVRKLDEKTVRQITKDGGKDQFYGIPDWAYEEEVFGGNSATWLSDDGKYVAFLRTNEKTVPEYPVQYFLSRPSGQEPKEGSENYPDVVKIKYPKAGAPNPFVDLQFYDVDKDEVFTVDTDDAFPDDDRIIIEVKWTSKGQVIVRQTNRESDLLRVFLVNAVTKTGKKIRGEDFQALDGGWVEPSQNLQFIPADPENGRERDGYIDTVIHNGYEHLGYFTPLDNPNPILLTQGNWEVASPPAVDLKRGLVYSVGAWGEAYDRHVFSVDLHGENFQNLTNPSSPGFHSVSFSSGAGYMLLRYSGPETPWEKVTSTPANEHVYEDIIETNTNLKDIVSQYALPQNIYHTIDIDGLTFSALERLPPDFNSSKQYPVVFFMYQGPGSQTVQRRFSVDYSSYLSTLGYIVVTVDGRGTGHRGRPIRTVVRGDLGHWESHDQIAAGKAWAAKPYVDANRLAIWGWSYGGFMTLKTLEQDAGRTFRYGMAVAPVTDWRFYDSIYTERYMRTPAHNPSGYENARISNTTALGQNTRFLVMHGTGDDNVHVQHSLTLLDALDLAGVHNYDVHVFPDSDHSISFHNARTMVYGRLTDWLINAFNGEWLRVIDPIPKSSRR